MKSTHHPLVAAYLDELERLLSHADPTTRLEVVAGVREHLDASVSPDATDDEVRDALTALGSPHDVAGAAYDGSPAPAPPQRRVWMSTTSVVLYCLTVAFTTLGAGGMVAFSTTSVTTSTVGSAEPPVTVEETTALLPSAGEVFLAVVGLPLFAFWLWLPALVLAILSPWWSTREKVFLALSPLTAGVGVVLTVLAAYVAGQAGAAVLLIWAFVLIVLIVRLAFVASRRSDAALPIGAR